MGRGVGLRDWVGTEMLAPPLSQAGPLVSRSSATASFPVGCTVHIYRCRLCLEPAFYEILFLANSTLCSNIVYMIKMHPNATVLPTHLPAVDFTAVLPLSPRLLSVWLWVGSALPHASLVPWLTLRVWLTGTTGEAVSLSRQSERMCALEHLGPYYFISFFCFLN